MKIEDEKVVSIHYDLKNATGEQLDSSDGMDPLAYLQGKGNIISGLENALLGKVEGDEVDVVIAPADGYGERAEQMVQKVPLEAFQDKAAVVEGARFEAETPQGPQVVVVTKVDSEEVTVDGNHPLAGETLHFNVKVVGVRDATEEELAHGHPHGPGGHSH